MDKLKDTIMKQAGGLIAGMILVLLVQITLAFAGVAPIGTKTWIQSGSKELGKDPMALFMQMAICK